MALYDPTYSSGAAELLSPQSTDAAISVPPPAVTSADGGPGKGTAPHYTSLRASDGAFKDVPLATPPTRESEHASAVGGDAAASERRTIERLYDTVHLFLAVGDAVGMALSFLLVLVWVLYVPLVSFSMHLSMGLCDDCDDYDSRVAHADSLPSTGEWFGITIAVLLHFALLCTWFVLWARGSTKRASYEVAYWSMVLRVVHAVVTTALFFAAGIGIFFAGGMFYAVALPWAMASVRWHRHATTSAGPQDTELGLVASDTMEVEQPQHVESNSSQCGVLFCSLGMLCASALCCAVIACGVDLAFTPTVFYSIPFLSVLAILTFGQLLALLGRSGTTLVVLTAGQAVCVSVSVGATLLGLMHMKHSWSKYLINGLLQYQGPYHSHHNQNLFAWGAVVCGALYAVTIFCFLFPLTSAYGRAKRQ